MSRKAKSRARWETIPLEEKESVKTIGPVVDQQPSDEKSKQEEPPTESQDVKPDKEKEDARAPEVQGTDLGAYTKQMAKPITGPEGRDDPEDIGHAYATPESIEKPETETVEEREEDREKHRGEGKPPI